MVDAHNVDGSPTILAVGAAVRVHGLLNRPELNGCMGRLTQDMGSERWGTQIEGQPAPMSLKTSNLQLSMPEGYWRLAAGSTVEIHGLQSRAELNGKTASLAQFLGERWMVQVEDGTEMISVKSSNLSPVACRPFATTTWESDLGELDSLAQMVMHYFVEGPKAYPVCRRLGRLQVTETSEELQPVPDLSTRQFPRTWCDLDFGESQRLFYKMSLCSRCSEVTYIFADVINALAAARTPLFQGSEIAGMFICVGFVVHSYRRLHIKKDFGQVYWQHSTKVHNGSRNHAWLEFPLPGASPNDQKARLILDLSAAQFDMCSPGKSFGLVRGPDQRYKKCYELPCTMAPLHFLNWAAQQNNVRFEGQHLVQNVQAIREKLGLSGGFSCIDTHKVLESMLDQIGVVGPGELLDAALNSPRISPIEEACSMTLRSLREMDANAARRMRQELGQGPSHESGGCPSQ